MSIKFDLDKEWKDSSLPVVNGIAYPDGRVEKVYVISEDRERKIEIGEELDINALLSKEEIDIVEVAELGQVDGLNSGIIVHYGMGFMGGDGFIVVESKADSSIKWAAFFEDSNPFERAEVVGDAIYAYNNLGEKWRFDINNPVDVSIVN